MRQYETRDRDGVRRLLTGTFGSSSAFDRYETGNPLGEPLGVVAERGGEVVGFNMWNAWRVRTRLGVRVAYQSGASAVDPSCRGQGVFGKLLAAGDEIARERGIGCFFGFPNPASYRSFLKAGWRHVATLNLYLSTSPCLGFGVPRVALPLPEPFARWRYGTSSARSIVTNGGSTVLRPASRFGVKVHRLLDVLDGAGERDLSALRGAVRRLPGPGIAMIRATPSRHVAMPGFVRLRRAWNTPLIVKPIGSDEPETNAIGTAQFCYGDIDAE